MEIKSPTDVGRCVCARRKTTTYDDHLNQSPASAWGPLKPSYSSYDYTIWGGGGGATPQVAGGRPPLAACTSSRKRALRFARRWMAMTTLTTTATRCHVSPTRAGFIISMLSSDCLT